MVKVFGLLMHAGSEEPYTYTSSTNSREHDKWKRFTLAFVIRNKHILHANFVTVVVRGCAGQRMYLTDRHTYNIYVVVEILSISRG